MKLCCGRLLLVTLTALASIPAAASSPGVLHLAMLDVGIRDLAPDNSAYNPRNPRDELMTSGDRRSASMIHASSYFSTPLRHDYQRSRDGHRLQGHGFGVNWGGKPR